MSQEIKSTTRYILLHLLASEYLTNYNKKTIRCFKSPQKAQQGLHLSCKRSEKVLHLTNGTNIYYEGSYSEGRMQSFYRQFEAIKAFTKVLFPNGDKLLYLYIDLDLKNFVNSDCLTLSEYKYFQENPERVIRKYENHI
jgi:hypothetical protein